MFIVLTEHGQQGETSWKGVMPQKCKTNDGKALGA